MLVLIGLDEAIASGECRIMRSPAMVQALYYATEGEPRWWGLPINLNDLTKEAIWVAVARGWMLDRGDSVCLTDAGRDLVRHG